MARNLDLTVEILFKGRYQRRGRYYGIHSVHPVEKYKYIEIPITKDSFEVPYFALPSLCEKVDHKIEKSPEYIVAILEDSGSTGYYKTLDRNLIDLIVEDFATRLIKVEVKGGSETFIYYVTRGAVFTEDFKPVLLCTLKLNRIIQDDGKVNYKCIKPIIHIEPDCFISQYDAMQKWIVKKFTTSSISIRHRLTNVDRFYFDNILYEDDNSFSEKLKIDIDDIPFVVKEVEAPSILTTNDDILQTALEYKEEIEI